MARSCHVSLRSDSTHGTQALSTPVCLRPAVEQITPGCSQRGQRLSFAHAQQYIQHLRDARAADSRLNHVLKNKAAVVISHSQLALAELQATGHDGDRLLPTAAATERIVRHMHVQKSELEQMMEVGVPASQSRAWWSLDACLPNGVSLIRCLHIVCSGPCLTACTRHAACAQWCHKREVFLQIEAGVYCTSRSQMALGPVLRACAGAAANLQLLGPLEKTSTELLVDATILKLTLEEALSNARKYGETTPLKVTAMLRSAPTSCSCTSLTRRPSHATPLTRGGRSISGRPTSDKVPVAVSRDDVSKDATLGSCGATARIPHCKSPRASPVTAAGPTEPSSSEELTLIIEVDSINREDVPRLSRHECEEVFAQGARIGVGRSQQLSSGLGLSTVRRAARAAEGSAYLWSSAPLPNGKPHTVFGLLLPARIAAPLQRNALQSDPPATTSTAVGAAPTAARPTLLVSPATALPPAAVPAQSVRASLTSAAQPKSAGTVAAHGGWSGLWPESLPRIHTLVADDVKTNRRALVLHLRKVGINPTDIVECATAEDAVEQVRHAREAADPFDLIFMDEAFGDGRMRGSEAVLTIRQYERLCTADGLRPPIVVRVTGHQNEDKLLEESFLREGANAAWGKPFPSAADGSMQRALGPLLEHLLAPSLLPPPLPPAVAPPTPAAGALPTPPTLAGVPSADQAAIDAFATSATPASSERSAAPTLNEWLGSPILRALEGESLEDGFTLDDLEIGQLTGMVEQPRCSMAPSKRNILAHEQLQRQAFVRQNQSVHRPWHAQHQRWLAQQQQVPPPQPRQPQEQPQEQPHLQQQVRQQTQQAAGQLADQQTYLLHEKLGEDGDEQVHCLKGLERESHS